jgi:hypothetical protein
VLFRSSHTCYGDIEAVKAVAYAAAECKLGGGNDRHCIGTGGGLAETECEWCVKAEIDRLLEVKHD